MGGTSQKISKTRKKSDQYRQLSTSSTALILEYAINDARRGDNYEKAEE